MPQEPRRRWMTPPRTREALAGRATPGVAGTTYVCLLDWLTATSRFPPVLLTGGTIRTLDPAAPVVGQLAVQGALIVAEAPTRRPGGRARRALRPARLHGLARALPDLVARAAPGAPGGRPLARRGARPRGRGARERARGRLAARARLARGRLDRGAHSRGARPRGAGRAGGADVEGLPLALAEQRGARARRRAARGARRRGRAERHPARERGLGVPRPLRPPHPRRDGRGLARGDARGRLAGRRRDPRQGRLARLVRGVRAAARGRRPADLRVWQSFPWDRLDDLRALGMRSGFGDDMLRLRLPQGLHGRHARLRDRAAAGRLGRRDQLARGARGRGAPRRRGRLAGGRARDRRRRQPRGARRVRGDPRRLAAARPAPADRARAAARRGGRGALRRDRRGGLGAVQPRAVRPRPGRAAVGGPRGRLRVPLAARRRARSSSTAPTRPSRSSTRSPESWPACCARSTSARRGAPSRR